MTDDSRERLTNRLAELGQRYLRRTMDEVAAMRTLAERYSEGERAVLHEIERAAHRIRGSGGMFGFDAIGNAAASIESAVTGEVAPAQLMQLIAALESQVQTDLGSNVQAS